MQKKYFLKAATFVTTVITMGIGNVYAEKLQCPTFNMIKNVSFSRVSFDRNDKSWNFFSWPFSYQGKEWNIWFITSLEGADPYPINPLEDGRNAYAKAKITNENPQPMRLDYLYSFCTYSRWPDDKVGIVAFNPGYNF